jgi:hypothetical protein
MDGNFWSDFFANFLSDLLVGGLLAGVLLASWARRQQRKDERRAELGKAIRYLEMLKKEIDNLFGQLPDLATAPRPYVEPEKIRIPTPFWDTLQPSGELPKLINPQLLASLAQFYDHLMYAKQGREWLLTRLIESDVARIHSLTQGEIENVIKVGLELALQSGRDLPDRLDSEAWALKEQREAL